MIRLRGSSKSEPHLFQLPLLTTLIVTKTFDNDQSQSFSLPESTSGTIFVRVKASGR